MNPQANAQFGALRRSAPYGNLFKAQETLRPALAEEAAKARPKTRVVCGMLIVEADPSLDPKMAVTPPQDRNLRYAIRVFEPPICK
jgi:hypothetical protein